MKLIWECNLCKSIQESDTHRRHDMNYCKCKKSAEALKDNCKHRCRECIYEEIRELKKQENPK